MAPSPRAFSRFCPTCNRGLGDERTLSLGGSGNGLSRFSSFMAAFVATSFYLNYREQKKRELLTKHTLPTQISPFASRKIPGVTSCDGSGEGPSSSTNKDWFDRSAYQYVIEELDKLRSSQMK